MSARITRRGVLAVDVGTSSVRAAVYDAAGRMLPRTYAAITYQVDTREPGEVSSDAEMLFRLVGRVIDQALAAVQRRRVEVLAVAMSCYWHSLVGLDAQGRPTTEVLTWADTRSTGQGNDLRSRADEHAYHQRTGCYFHASFWPAKLRWLGTERPQVLRKTQGWVSFAELCVQRWFGERRVSISMASGTGLFDPHTCRWDQASLDLAEIDAEKLSPVHEWDEAMSGLRPVFSRRWPALARVPWYLALGDGGLSNIGAGCVEDDRACAMVGTSAALRVVKEAGTLEIPWGTFAYRLDRRRWVLGGALSEGGNALQWIADAFGFKSPALLEAAIRSLPPDGHGLTVLPFWAGERSPNWRGDTRAAITGISLSTRPAHIARATMEAISYQFGYVFEAMMQTTSRPRLLVGSGGRLRHSPVWMQMLADVLGVIVRRSPEAEASARGAALLALAALGLRPGIWREPPPAGQSFRPRPAAQAAYQAGRERQAELYSLLFPAPGAPPLNALGTGRRRLEAAKGG
jgi:gluconokinase